MRLRTMLLSACLAALWIHGMVSQLHSGEAAMRYLALSLAVVAIGVWRWQPQRALRRRLRDRQPPKQ